MSSNDQTENKILTIPNLVTTLRILLIPIFVYLGWDRSRLIESAFLLAFIGATDWIDGFLARRLNQVSTVGKVIDPTADRLLLLAAFVVTVHLSLIPWWLLALVLIRELLVSIIVGLAALRFKTRFDVVWYGKAGTLLTMFGFPLFVLAGAHNSYFHAFIFAGYLFMVPGVFVLFIALISYAKQLNKLAKSTHNPWQA